MQTSKLPREGQKIKLGNVISLTIDHGTRVIIRLTWNFYRVEFGDVPGYDAISIELAGTRCHFRVISNSIDGLVSIPQLVR